MASVIALILVSSIYLWRHRCGRGLDFRRLNRNARDGCFAAVSSECGTSADVFGDATSFRDFRVVSVRTLFAFGVADCSRALFLGWTLTWSEAGISE